LLADAGSLGGLDAGGVFGPVLAAGARHGIPVTVAAVGPSEDGTPLSQLWGAAAVLVRPDQHVAWRGNSPVEAAAALSVAAGWAPAFPPARPEESAPSIETRSARVDAVIP
jgi:hypothetical protein